MSAPSAARFLSYPATVNTGHGAFRTTSCTADHGICAAAFADAVRFAPITIKSTLNFALAVSTPSGRKSVPTTNSTSCSRPVSAGRHSRNCARHRLRDVSSHSSTSSAAAPAGAYADRLADRRRHGSDHVQQNQLRLLLSGQRERQRKSLRRPLAKVGREQNPAKSVPARNGRDVGLRANRHHRAGCDPQQFLRHGTQRQFLKASTSPRADDQKIDLFFFDHRRHLLCHRPVLDQSGVQSSAPVLMLSTSAFISFSAAIRSRFSSYGSSSAAYWRSKCNTWTMDNWALFSAASASASQQRSPGRLREICCDQNVVKSCTGLRRFRLRV